MSANSNPNNEALYKTKASVTPTGLIYTIKAHELEQHMVKEFNSAGINGITHVEMQVKENGKVAIYLFLSMRSNALEKSRSNAPKRLAYKIEGSNKTRLTAEAKSIIEPFEAYESKCGMMDNEYYIRLDIFSCLGDMLSAEPHLHNIRIIETAKVDKQYVLAVIKQDISAFTNNNRNDDSKYGRMISRLERDRY